jgi:hypothetical protein
LAGLPPLHHAGHGTVTIRRLWSTVRHLNGRHAGV